ncbi:MULTISPECIES: 6-pyruvoyl trahydropterin synthase family protein [Hymenobacter]|jgi:6-pyruvoyltetrahydropterin/6-carboxytetrahydropterin synthase|uniref:6-carboxy-5,6,7,8-tetrahydropterin synthase n=1 Tax=Hymenobacter yonginensis TaxID=748197 RepID=A0ABY7PKT9_9BACT|nr:MULTISPECIES: 6-carboxytetrahydropterin synthase [Hymenobacter]AII52846.1 6-pyruvoyl tetrahydrobiopterin synthase [Hymenobacter sp. APR13]WBO83227.1 6-carboxytetrahydropterin synthase [Hymenobacter yonginensis]
MSVTVCRKEHFNAAHRLHNPAWSPEQNQQVFGKCNNPSYHGHNYELIVRLTGEIDPDTGYVYDMKRLSDLIKREILDTFDHRNLNLDTEEFRHLNPTAENMAVVIWNRLRTHIESRLALSVTLYETERNFVEYHG